MMRDTEQSERPRFGWIRGLVGQAVLTAASVAICGIVGWVGLVVPHAVRLMVGAEFSRLLPLAMLIERTMCR